MQSEHSSIDALISFAKQKIKEPDCPNKSTWQCFLKRHGVEPV